MAISTREVALGRAAGKLPFAARLGSGPPPRGWEVALLRGWPSSTAWGLESCSPLAVRGKGKSWESGTAPVWGELPSSRAWEVALLRCGWEVALLRWAGKLPSSSRWWEVALLLPVVGSCPPLRRWWEVADSGHRTRSTVRRLIPKAHASPCAVAASGIEVLQPLKCCSTMHEEDLCAEHGKHRGSILCAGLALLTNEGV